MSLKLALFGQVPSGLQAPLSSLAASMGLAVVGPFADLAGARSTLSGSAPDIAVVSTTFSDGSAWTLLAELAESARPAALLVVGAKDEEAATAFDHRATDFLRWPAADGRLATALSRARQLALQQAVQRTADDLQRLLIEARGAGVELGAATGRADDLRRRRLSAGSTGTLVATSPRRGAKGGDGGEDGVLDLSQADGGVAAGAGHPLRVLVREGRRTRFVSLLDVDWFEADGNYIQVHAGEQQFRTRGTISAIESALDPRQFVRIHRRVVVNMDRVREMSPLPGGDGLLTLGNGSTLRLSRTYRSRVR